MRPEWARRAWGAPLLVHAAVLSVLLVALAFAVGTGTSLSEDEGAAIVQARQLAEHHTWIVADPAPGVDPHGTFYPYRLSDGGARGRAPFARHPAYVVVLAGLWSFGGVNALVGLSLAGTVLAALAAAQLAARLDPRLARPALWALGVGSPLLFDGFLVIAHTVAAACAGWLVLTARPLKASRASFAAAAVLAAGLTFVRTEGLLFVAALAIVGFVFRPRAGAVAALLGAGVAAVVDGLWLRHILGPASALASTGGGTVREPHDLASRWRGAVTTLVRFSYPGGDRANVLLLIALLLSAAAGCMFRWRPQLAAALTGAAALAVVARLLVGHPQVVPGLFVVCPVLWAAVWARGFGWRDVPVRPLVMVCVLFGLAVLATQYAQGGGIEWGGRYFAVALPVAVVLAVRALRAAPRPMIVALVAASVALAGLGVGALRVTHDHTRRLLAAIPPHGLALTTAGLLPRLDWPAFEDRQWLLVENAKSVPLVLRRLHAAGVGRVSVVFPTAITPPGFEHAGVPVQGMAWRVATVTP